MAAKIAAFITTFVINIALGVVIFFFMLLAMNGFSESDATWGLAVYIVLAVAVSIPVSVTAVLLVRLLVKKQFSDTVSTLIAVPVCSTIGTTLICASGVIGMMVAEFVRVNY